MSIHRTVYNNLGLRVVRKQAIDGTFHYSAWLDEVETAIAQITRKNGRRWGVTVRGTDIGDFPTMTDAALAAWDEYAHPGAVVRTWKVANRYYEHMVRAALS